MKLYQRFIKPVFNWPGPYGEGENRDIEMSGQWYPEEKQEELFEKYKHLHHPENWERVGFVSRYEEYKEPIS